MPARNGYIADRPCGYYPTEDPTSPIQWSEITLPPRLYARLLGLYHEDTFRGSYGDMASTLATWGSDGRAQPFQVLWRDMRLPGRPSPGELREVIAFLAHDHGWEPNLPTLIPLLEHGEPDFQERGYIDAILQSGREDLYAEMSARWLVADSLVTIAAAMTTPGFSSNWAEANVESRERIAEIMPLLCSLWPYAEAIWGTPMNRHIIWKDVGAGVRFQGDW